MRGLRSRNPFTVCIVRHEFDDARAKRGDELAVVRDDDDADAVGAQGVDEAHDLHPCAPVLPEGRLVEDQHARCGGERGGHGQAPLFAAGQCVGVHLRVLVEVEPAQQCHAALAGGGLVHAGACGPEHDFAEHARAGELVFGVLEDVGDP